MSWPSWRLKVASYQHLFASHSIAHHDSPSLLISLSHERCARVDDQGVLDGVVRHVTVDIPGGGRERSNLGSCGCPIPRKSFLQGSVISSFAIPKCKPFTVQTRPRWKNLFGESVIDLIVKTIKDMPWPCFGALNHAQTLTENTTHTAETPELNMCGARVGGRVYFQISTLDRVEGHWGAAVSKELLACRSVSLEWDES